MIDSAFYPELNILQHILCWIITVDLYEPRYNYLI